MKRDLDLIAESLQGSREAFGQIVGRYQSLVSAMAYSAVGDIALSEDIAQETFIHAWKQLATLREKSKFKAWLRSIARNCINSSLRRLRHDIMNRAAPLERASDVASTIPSPQASAISREEQAIVWTALKDVPEICREPLILYYRQHQSIRAVAEALDLTDDVVKQRLARGRGMLAEKIANFVERKLAESAPGESFLAAVVAALPAFTLQTAVTGMAATAAKGSWVAKLAATLQPAGVILGPLLGLFGMLIGLRASVKNCKSPRERKFMLRSMSILLLFPVVMIGGLPLLVWLEAPPRVRPVYWGRFLVAFLIGTLVFVFWCRWKLARIRKEEGTYVKPHRYVLEMPKGNIYGSFAGSIFGSLIWLYNTAIQANDLNVVWIVLIAGLGLFLISTKACLRARHRYHRITTGTFVAAGIINVLVVNLRWADWMKSPRFASAHARWSLWQINLAIGVVIIIVIVLSVLWDRNLQRKLRKEHEEPTKQAAWGNTSDRDAPSA